MRPACPALHTVGGGTGDAASAYKLVFGGFGNNIFNPALVGRVLVHLSFGDKLLPYVNGMAGAQGIVDITSTATPATMLAGTNWMGGADFSYTLMDWYTWWNFGRNMYLVNLTCRSCFGIEKSL